MTGSRASASPDAPAGRRRALLVSPSWIGDAILSLPAAQAFRAGNPDLDLWILTKPGTSAIWRMSPAAAGLISLEPGFLGIRKAVRGVRSGGFETAWILPLSWRSALVPFLAGIPERIGRRGHGRAWLLSRALPDPVPAARRHQSVETADVLCPGRSGPLPVPDVRVPPETRARMSADLSGWPAPRIALMPGAARGPSKRWPEERFAEAGRILAETRRGSVWVTGSPGERGLCERVARMAGGVSWAGRTTAIEWAALLSLSDLAVCNDSGGMHLAAALGVPGVALFGATDPEITGPVSGRFRVLRPEIPVHPSRSVRRDDPAARGALESIRVARVVEAALDLLS